MEKLKALIKKLLTREVIMYLVFGVLTTAVSFVSFYAAERLLGIDYTVSNVISWILSVTFAYVTNKLFVFKSRGVRGMALVWEAARFFLSRLATLAIEEVLLILLVEKLAVDSLVAKVIVTVIVVILNYVFSKLAVFTKRKKDTEG